MSTETTYAENEDKDLDYSNDEDYAKAIARELERILREKFG